MKRLLLSMSVMALASGLLVTTTGERSAAAEAKKPVAIPAKATAPDWQKKWQDTVTAAKQEGEVMIYLNAPSDARMVISDAFYKKFGLKLGIVMGSGEELNAKLAAEYRAGINQVDVIMAGATITVNSKALGILSHIEPMLILPDVKDPKSWLYDQMPYFDKDGIIASYLAVKNPTIFYNADLIKEGEITSHLDLLKPQWKDKIVMYDPSISGAGQSGSYFLTLEWGGNEKVYEYITSLIKQQNTIVTRDMRQQVEWVARGKYSVALWPQLPATSQFLKAGAHLAAATIKEKERVGASNGALAIPTKPAHPNATIVFINWFLSHEGQAVAVKAMGAGSARKDVLAEGVNPIYIPKPGEKCNIENEESILSRPQFQEGLKKVFADLNK